MGPGFGDDIGKALVAFLLIAVVVAFGLGVGCAVAWKYLPSVEIHWTKPNAEPGERSGE